MGDWLELDGMGTVAVERIVAVGRAQAAASKRLLQAMPATQVIVLTGGRRRQSVLILDSGQAIVTPLPVAEVIRRLREKS